MPIVVPRGDNARAIDLIQSLVHDWIFANCSPSDQQILMAHLNWMRMQYDDLVVACRFETSGDQRVTRIYLEASFKHQMTKPNGRWSP